MQARAIHADLESFLVNLLSISSSNVRGRVIEMAVVGSVDLRRLIFDNSCKESGATLRKMLPRWMELELVSCRYDTLQ